MPAPVVCRSLGNLELNSLIAPSLATFSNGLWTFGDLRDTCGSRYPHDNGTEDLRPRHFGWAAAEDKRPHISIRGIYGGVPVEQVRSVLDHGTRRPATGVMVFNWGSLKGKMDKVNEEVAGYRLSKTIQLHWLPDGDHSFKPRKLSGRSQADN